MIDRLIGHLSDIEQEIYEDQLRHVHSGVLVKKNLVIDDKSKLVAVALSSSIILSHNIRRNVLFNPQKCFFPLDKIVIKKYDENFYLVKLKEKGPDRQTVESKDNIFESNLVVVKFKKEFHSYMKELTIEAFIQMNCLRLFKLIGINNPFFDKISKDNYESLEIEFNRIMNDLCLQNSFNFDLDDVRLYQRGLVVSKEGIDFDFASLEKTGKPENVWDKSELIKIT